MSESTYTIHAKTLEVRSFSSNRNAKNYGNGVHSFASVEELNDSRVRDDEMRAVYLSVTGYETRVKDRGYLSELLFNALAAAKIPRTDSEMDFSIQLNKSTKEKLVTEQNETVSVHEVVSELTSPEVVKEKRSAKRLDVTSDDPVKAFGVIAGSNRAKALDLLWAKKGQKVPMAEIIRTIYGSDDIKKYLGAASLVVKGLILSAQKEGIKFGVTKSGKGADVEYTIDTK